MAEEGVANRHSIENPSLPSCSSILISQHQSNLGVVESGFLDETAKLLSLGEIPIFHFAIESPTKT